MNETTGVVLETKRDESRVNLLFLALGHGVTDAYSNFFPGLVFFLSDRLSLTAAHVGLLTTVVSITGSMSQLIYGHLADRVRRAYFIVLGPAAAAIFMSLLGSANSLAVLAILLALGGSGVASFHPQAAIGAGSGPVRRRGADLAFFISVGTAGYALGPLFATQVAVRFGLERTWLAAIPGVLAALLLYATVYRRLEAGYRSGPEDDGSKGDIAASPLLPARKPRLPATIVALWGIVSLRAAVSTSLIQFMPLFLKEREFGPTYASAAVSLFVFAGAVGGMAGGPLADRWGRRRVLIGSLLLSTPALCGLTLVPSAAFLALFFTAGFVLNISAPANVAMAQEIAPERQGTASAWVQGFAFGTGGLLAGLAGYAADRTSIALVYQVLAFVPALTVPIAAMLPETLHGSRKG
ncbi:MAG: MFS transporter [Armatimonadetes bacterium]|nr:MFS transporter [Armatimonadota bacterium]